MVAKTAAQQNAAHILVGRIVAVVVKAVVGVVVGVVGLQQIIVAHGGAG